MHVVSEFTQMREVNSGIAALEMSRIGWAYSTPELKDIWFYFFIIVKNQK